MTASIFSSLTTAIQTALQAATPVADRISRGHLAPLSAEKTTAVAIRPLQASGQRLLMANPVEWQSVVAIDCMARATVGQDPEDAIDALLQAVYSRLQTAAFSGAGVVDTGFDPAIDWDFEEADTSLVVASLTFRATQQSQSATLLAYP